MHGLCRNPVWAAWLSLHSSTLFLLFGGSLHPTRVSEDLLAPMESLYIIGISAITPHNILSPYIIIMPYTPVWIPRQKGVTADFIIEFHWILAPCTVSGITNPVIWSSHWVILRHYACCCIEYNVATYFQWILSLSPQLHYFSSLLSAWEQYTRLPKLEYRTVVEELGLHAGTHHCHHGTFPDSWLSRYTQVSALVPSWTSSD